jgi:TonB family protein
MSTPTELWKKWESRIVEGKFPLQRWLGGSDHSAVFLTERDGEQPQKAVLKLISAEGLNEEAQLFRWTDAAKLSHPHLVRLFECGHCQIDDTRLLYVVMEYAEEDLAQILPLRPLSSAESSEMLLPTAQALAFLHRAGLVHGRIKPSNVMATDNQLKISADGLRKIGDRGNLREPGPYDAPEVLTEGLSPAADVWSLGATLVAVLTQHEPEGRNGGREVAVPEMLSESFREIVQQCRRADPRQRCTAAEIVSRLQSPATSAARVAQAPAPKERPKRWIVVPIVVAALFLMALVGGRFMARPPRIPAAQTSATEPQPAPADAPAAQSPAPFPEKENQAQTQRGVTHGTVLQQTLPDVSRNSRNTIQGKIRVSVRVAVDASGNVSQATLTSPGPSQYFAKLALTAARRWKFSPPQKDGRAKASEWLLRFQFGRISTDVFPTQVNP